MAENGRFEFGKNWASFLAHIDEKRIEAAIDSLKNSLDIANLNGRKVLDIGSGSGLFSLAAIRLGAEVVSVDYDRDSVACTQELKQRYADNTEAWTVLQGSVLDEEFMDSLGKFDGVYSWGVLHHTGKMNEAIRIAKNCVTQKGWFFIAIYNDQGAASKRWLAIKTLYNKLPTPLRIPYVGFIAAFYEFIFAIKRALTLKNPFSSSIDGEKRRGMTIWYDWIDWVGGLPFEVATPEEIIIPLHRDGFILSHLKTLRKGWGCNEYVFQLM